MTNDEHPKNDECRSTNDQTGIERIFRHSSFVIPSSFVIRHSSFFVFLASAAIAGSTVSGPGLTWDEPAYLRSQNNLKRWLGDLSSSKDWGEFRELFSKERIHRGWEFNRFGHNFHPPMGSFFELMSLKLFGWRWDDISARRLASALELAAVVTMLFSFLGRRYGLASGLVAGFSLLFMPRLMGHAHVIGTDMPMLLFWVTTSLAFWRALESRVWQWIFGVSLGLLFLTKFSGMVILVPLGGWYLLTIWSHRPRKNRESWPGWNFEWELPLVALFATPLTAVALNPTWWHEPIAGLAHYLDLNLSRKDHLPDISIFYLGKQYIYSLPWHNAFVLMAVTIPYGILLLGLIGGTRALFVFRSDRLPLYFVVQMLTFPLLRMLPVPAHDGVRLFLPTFFFWAGLAGLGAGWLVRKIGATPRRKPVVWTILLCLGPGWAGFEWIRIHPYELSYYNLGLSRAMDLGFEPTYWYDALTPRDLKELNRTIPKNASVIVHVDPKINVETFFVLQQLGRLRADINLDPAKVEGLHWVWLLTHSSKASAFTRLLYACKPWYENGPEGVRLISVIDPDSVALAWALHTLTVERGKTEWQKLKLREPVFEMSADEIRQAIELIEEHGSSAPDHPKGVSENVQFLVRSFFFRGRVDSNLQRILHENPEAMDRAIEIISTRPDDVRKVLEYPGYQRPEKFGGYFE